jgi:hypothetical protein
MELTKEEQKILGHATEGCLRQASKHRWFLPGVVVGLVGAAMMIAEGVMNLMSGKEGYPIIASGLVLAAYLVGQYASSRFRTAALSLIRKLQNERDNP